MKSALTVSTSQVSRVWNEEALWQEEIFEKPDPFCAILQGKTAVLRVFLHPSPTPQKGGKGEWK